MIGLDADGIPQFHLIDSNLEDADVTDESRLIPSITWTTPGPLLASSPLGDEQLSATEVEDYDRRANSDRLLF
jgi:hypothetical protein